ncbi:Cytoplasmic GTPase/eEF2-like protein (ribosomal biogenesis) [Lecanora helva]
MPVVNPEKLIALQLNADEIRNICILAHVDHGKTSLTDALIATNGIISPKLAGKIRYLDSRPDEQLRGITMESSAISLYFSLLRRSAREATPVQKEYLINLIDSPGHIDFSSEVSTASRVCDGALVLVDAVEGVCSQTVTVLRQTWTERLKPLLVINKIDRLIVELKMSPSEAYSHLSKLLEQVNAVIGSFFQGERMEEDLQWRERVEEKVAAKAALEEEKAQKKAAKATSESLDESESIATSGVEGTFEEKDDEDLYFAPENNNVIFSSAVDGWAFTVKQFASLYEKKLGMKRSILEKVLWGDFYLEPKTKRILGAKHLKGRVLKPMFVQLVLDNIWAVYEATTGGNKGKGDPVMVEKITKSLSLTIPPHILRSRDSRAIMSTIFSSWLPLSTAVLVSTIEHLPSPPVAQASRLPALIDASPGAKHVDPQIRDAMINIKTSKHDPVVAYVSKMVAVPESELPQSKRKTGGAMTGEEARDLARKKRAEFEKAQSALTGDATDSGLNGMTQALGESSLEEVNGSATLDLSRTADLEHLIGFARLYSGILSVGDSVYVLPPKFSPANPDVTPIPQKVTVTSLYLLMGRGLEALTSVPAGVVFGVAGLEGHILKSGTLCSQLEGAVNLAGVNRGSQPIVRVALEPANPGDLDKMIKGMKLLEQSDPCAQYEVLENGEHVVLTAGELHLERCLKDLRERYARCEIQAGEPIVPYRETTVEALDMNPPKNKDLPRGTVIGTTTSKQISIRLRVRPLPPTVTEFLEKNIGAIRRFYSEKKAREGGEPSKSINGGKVDDEEEEEDREALPAAQGSMLSLLDFREKLRSTFADAKGEGDIWTDVVEKICAFGPRRVGPNILIDATKQDICQKFLQEGNETPTDSTQDPSRSSLHPSDFSDKITHAFQLATAQGPMCHEPIQGIAVFLEEVTINSTPTTTQSDIEAQQQQHQPPTTSSSSSSTDHHLGRLTGEIIKTTHTAIHTAFFDYSPRLLLAIYSLEIACPTPVLGRVYSVLSRRRGRILTEELKEGTPFYQISALLPVVESFGFSDEIRKRTSGAAQPQLVFKGFEVLDEDPYWVPRSEEELEDFGEKGDRERVSARYLEGVRRRKGMVVQRKVVGDAEKQKTLKR